MDGDAVAVCVVLFAVISGCCVAILSHRFRHPRYVAGCLDCLLDRVEP